MPYSDYAQHVRVDDHYNFYTISHIFTQPHPPQNELTIKVIKNMNI